MGTTLDNGTYLPDEGERNCYDGLAGNWVALDNHIGSTNIHVTINDKQAWDGHVADTTIHVTSADKQTWNSHVADTTIHVTFADKESWNNHIADTVKHVTAEDKQAWNGKADASALTAHTGDTTIHVTAEDKQAWNGHVADSVKHVTAEDKAKWDAVTGKANDADVVHKSGNETISGDKVFNTRLIKNIDVVLGTTPSTGKFSNIDIADNNKNSLLQILGGVYDTGNSYARFFVQNKMADDGTGLSPTGTLRACGFNINLPATNTFDGQGSITPRANQTTDFGLSAYQWRNLWCKKLYLNGTLLDPSAFVTTDTAQTITGNKTFSTINGVEPSSLSLPSGNASDIIDISSYLTYLDGTANSYTVPANGWISISMNNCSGMQAYITGFWGHQIVRPTLGIVRFLMPVLKNQTAKILIFNGTIDYARFIPCQGNV